MTCHHKWLDSFNTRCLTHSIILGNNTALIIHSSGQICTSMLINGHTVYIVLQDVLYILDLMKNLISTSHLVQLMCTIHLD